ncbi:MAG: amidase [Pseudomonadota bacterium]
MMREASTDDMNAGAPPPREPSQRTLGAQIDAFALGRFTPVQMLETYAARAARFNPRLNAIIDTRLEAAREEAAASADRWGRGAPLSDIDGAVVLVKANIAVEGLPWTAGIRAYERRIAREDAPAVARLKAAGAIILGTLNMEEGALGAITDNPWLGRCFNPWCEGEDITPGGSSGGSGAAVAAGLCAAALGTDTMGSVRIPAAYCGVAGHKPSRDLISTEGVIALSATLDHVGPLTRSARDLRALTQALGGEAMAAGFRIAGARIGRWRFEDALDCDPDIYELYEAVLSGLAEAGAQIIDVKPQHYAYARSRRRGLLISEVEGFAAHETAMDDTPDGFSRTFRDLLHWGAKQGADKVEAAYAAIRACEADALDWFKRCAVVLAPTALEPAFRFGEEIPAGQADLTAFADMAGVPATAAASGLTASGLPASVQVIGPKGADARTIAVAAEIEARAGGPLVPPGY